MNSEGKNRFWNEGFTLVELVVVITILGILAGIGYVGYGGYIKYAHRAADDEYIGAVNEAFSAACQEKGVNYTKLSGGSAKVSFRDSTNGVTDTVLLSVGLPNYNSSQEKNESKMQSIKDSFETYFGGKKGNKEMKLKYYSADNIVFVGSGELFVAFGDPESASSSIWKQSNFSGAKEEHLKDITHVLKNFLGAAGEKIPQEANLSTVFSGLNKNGLNISSEQQKEIEDFFAQHNLSTSEQLSRDLLGNGFSAYIAGKTAQYAKDPEGRSELLENLRNFDVTEFQDTHGKNYKQDVDNYTDKLIEIPMQLAALEAYYNSGQASEGFKQRFNDLIEGYKTGTAGLDGLLKMQSGAVSVFLAKGDAKPDPHELENFRAYKNSSQFDTDMSAYFDMMEKAAGKIGDSDASADSFLDDIFSFPSVNP